MIRIHISSPIELLHSDHMGEKEPKAKWFLSIVGILCLGIGYDSVNYHKKSFNGILFFLCGCCTCDYWNVFIVYIHISDLLKINEEKQELLL